MRRAVLFGGYGTFGSHVARELARLGVPTVIAGRDLSKAEEFAGKLGPNHRALAADVTNLDSCLEALSDGFVAVNCAGPFSILGRAILDACLETACDYADISEDRGYAALVRDYSERFKQRGLTAVYGCSSLPAISGALGLVARKGTDSAPERVRVSLFIGNNNPKGLAAIRSAVCLLGKEIDAPQGKLSGFRGGETVSLPEPFGRRRVYNFDSPEYDLFPELFGARSVSVKVGFELKSANRTFALLAALSSNYGDRLAIFLERTGRLFRGIGSSGGAVMTELFYKDGSIRYSALSSNKDAQRMAALPCVLAVEALCNGSAKVPGTVTAYELLGASEMLNRIASEGCFKLTTKTQRTQRA